MPDITELQRRYRDLHGHWDDGLARAARCDPEFFETYLDMATVALRQGPLDRKTCDFVTIAANAAVTHLNGAATRQAIANARRNGASDAELVELLQVISVLGIHGYMLGAPIAIAESGKAATGADAPRFAMGERENAIKQAFSAGRGYWSPLLEDMVMASPAFFEAYTRFSSHPWKRGVLEPCVKELLYVAIDASTTHLHEAGTRIHTANALRYGASPAAIVQVMEIVSCIGFQSYLLGMAEATQG